MPMTARAAMSWSTPPANAAAADAAPKIDEADASARPCDRTGRRGCPAVSSRPANTSVYASTTHCSSADAGAEVAHERGQRHVDDRVVDHDHEQAHAEHGEGQPSGGGARGRRPVPVSTGVERSERTTGSAEVTVSVMGNSCVLPRCYDTVISTSCYNVRYCKCQARDGPHGRNWATDGTHPRRTGATRSSRQPASCCRPRAPSALTRPADRRRRRLLDDGPLQPLRRQGRRGRRAVRRGLRASGRRA